MKRPQNFSNVTLLTTVFIYYDNAHSYFTKMWHSLTCDILGMKIANLIGNDDGITVSKNKLFLVD